MRTSLCVCVFVPIKIRMGYDGGNDNDGGGRDNGKY